MTDGAKLYDLDFHAWSEQQTGHIRAAAGTYPNLLIDWNEVAEEIEDLDKPLERELQSRLATIIEHLLKLQVSPAIDPRDDWVETVLRERGRIELLLAQSPSLRPKVPTLLPDAQRTATRLVIASLERRGEISKAEARLLAAQEMTLEQAVGEWLPDRRSLTDNALT